MPFEIHSMKMIEEMKPERSCVAVLGKCVYRSGVILVKLNGFHPNNNLLRFIPKSQQQYQSIVYESSNNTKVLDLWCVCVCIEICLI